MFDLGNTVANPVLGGVAEWAGYRAMFSVVGTGVLVAAMAVWRRGTALLVVKGHTAG